MSQNLTTKKGQCTNSGNCSKADAKEIIEVNLGDDFICPECKGSLVEIEIEAETEIKIEAENKVEIETKEKVKKEKIKKEKIKKEKTKGKRKALKWILIITIILAVLGVGGYFAWTELIPADLKCKYFNIDCTPSTPTQPQAEGQTPESITPNKTSLELKNTNENEQQTANAGKDEVIEKIEVVIGVALDKTTLSLETGATEQLTATVEPENATKKEINWSSNNPAVATVSQTGLVTAVANGNAIISANTENRLSASCNITVEKLIGVTSVKLDKTTLSLKKGESGQLKQTISPADATNKEVSWMSSDESVATVSQSGLVTVVAEKGSAKITVTTTDGGKTATCNLTVKSDNVNTDSSSGTISVTGGSYTGQMKNGKPHGMGTIRYNSRTLIDSRDTKKRYAEAKWYLVGDFKEGRLLQGILYDENGNSMEKIIIGG